MVKIKWVITKMPIKMRYRLALCGVLKICNKYLLMKILANFRSRWKIAIDSKTCCFKLKVAKFR